MKNNDFIKTEIKKFNFNSFDMRIIAIMSANEKMSAGEIRKAVDIAPNNLTSHLKKLEKMKIIKVKNNGIGRKKEISLNLEDTQVSWLIIGIQIFFLFHHYPENEQKKLKHQAQDIFNKFQNNNKKV